MAAACPASPTEAARRGVSLVPADRRHQGLMLDRSVARNITLVSVGALARGAPWLRRSEHARRGAAPDRAAAHQGPRARPTMVGSLSGGNQQKVVIGRWLEVSPRA